MLMHDHVEQGLCRFHMAVSGAMSGDMNAAMHRVLRGMVVRQTRYRADI